MSEAVAEEYRSSLHDLNFNSKPHINMLTMLAEDNQKFAPLIVDTIVKHIHSVQPDLKLPSLYLVDSIMKNIGGQYITLFCKCIVTVFTTVFSKVEEATRSSLFKLRQTWNEILSKQILYEIDCKVHNIDPAWPITATPPVAKVAPTKNTIHINPKFVGGTVAQTPHPLGNQGKSMTLKKTEEIPKNTEPEMSVLKNPDKMLKMIEEKKRELNALTQKKLEMAAEQRKKTMRANAIPQQNIEKKNENHRDPRLKKNVLIHQTAAETAKNSLQSVVVVPKTPSDVIINQTFDEVSKLNSKKCSPKNELLNQGFPNETFHSSIKDQEIKGAKNINKNKNFKENNMQKHFTDNDNSTNKNAKFLNKKHPLSPEKNTVPSKMPCKEFGNKMNRPTTHTKRLPQSQIETPIAKKARFENTKSNNKSNVQLNVSSYGGNDPLSRVKNEEMSGKNFPSIQKSEESLPIGNKDTDYRIQWPQQSGRFPYFRSDDSIMFGNKDTDYRHQVKNKQWPPQGPESRLYPQNGNLNDIPVNEPRYPAIKMESSLKIKTEKVDDLDKMQNVCNLDVSQIKKEVSDPMYGPNEVFPRDRLPPSQIKTHMLDDRNRKLYYAKDHCFPNIDSKEAREMTYRGLPRNAYNEGLVSGASAQWNNGGSKGNHSNGSAIDRNNDMHNIPWTQPSYRDVDGLAPDQHLSISRQTANVPSAASWDLKPRPSLPPPPAIPPALSNLSLPPNLPSLSSLSATNMNQLSNTNMPPSSWNPLPPPPMFTGTVPDVLKPAPLPSTIISNTSVPPETMTATSSITVPTMPLNVVTIYEKLLALGMIKPEKKTDVPALEIVPENIENNENNPVEKKDVKSEEPEPEILLTAKSLRDFRSSIVAALYEGSQCATCGLRFKEMQSEQYSRHLDWHFRMNRREKDGAKKAYSRRWFYEVKDWIQFNEIEEVEERTPSYFELQADGNNAKNEEKEEIQSVPASKCGTEEKCSVCSETFQLFWVEEEEEWHLKHAVRHDGKAYHPMCYEDFEKSNRKSEKEAEESLSDSAKEEEKAQSIEEASAIKIVEEKLSEDEKKSLINQSNEEVTFESDKDIKMEISPEEDSCKMETDKEPFIGKAVAMETESIVDEAMEVDPVNIETSIVTPEESEKEESITVSKKEDSKIESEKEECKEASEKTASAVPEKEGNEIPEKEGNEIPENEGNEIPEKEENEIPEKEENEIPEKEEIELPEKGKNETSEKEKNEISEKEEKEVHEKEEKEVPEKKEKEVPEKEEKEVSEKEEKEISEKKEKEITEKKENEIPEKEENKVPTMEDNVERILPKKNISTNSDSESENLDEFRPPTPDPRFKVLPPVSKGTELSALCTIM